MQMRWGLGPVFTLESRLNARRWQVYAGRAFFVVVLLVGMVIVWITNVHLAVGPVGTAPTFAKMAEVGKWFFYTLTGIQVSLILLAAPAAAAGSMGMDRARGTILHMFVTDLSDAEIVLGTLAARLAPVCAMIVCGVPVTALAALLGGIDFGALAGAFVVSLALAVLGCALALTLSVWVTKTHEVLMAVYLAEGLWLLALPLWWDLSRFVTIMSPPAWFQKANPYVLVFAPYNKPGFAGFADFAGFVGCVLVISAALVGLSIARLRRVVVGQSSQPAKAERRWRLPVLQRLLPSWTGPTLDGNPVLWREWHRNRPSRLARLLWACLLLLTWAVVAWGTYDLIVQYPSWEGLIVTGLMLQATFGLLMLSATAPTALAEERVRGSLDVLLATPLSTSTIVVAKWWGVYRRVLVLVPIPVYVAVMMASNMPELGVIPATLSAQYKVPLKPLDRVFAATFCPADFLASGALIVSLGLALSIWVRRQGRAVALSVILFFLIGIVLPIMAQIFLSTLYYHLQNYMRKALPDYRWLTECGVALSPIFGPVSSLQVLGWYQAPERTRRWIGLGVVILIKSAIAGLLLWFSVLTFDRRLGRVPGSRSAARQEEPVVLEERVPSA